MSIQTVDGVAIHYDLYGAGPPLLLLHGLTGTGRQWTPFVQQLQTDYQVIVPDLPGHGRSGIPGGAFTHRKTAHSMYGLLDSLQVNDLCAIGMSSGGNVLLHMATQQPHRIRSMVLWSATTYFPPQCRDVFATIDPDKITETDWPWLRDHAGGRAQIVWLLQQFRSLKDSYDDMDFTSPLLSTVKAKTLVVHGDRDQFFPVSIPVALYESIPTAYLWILPNTAHGFPDETSAEVMQRCRAFFAGKWSAT